VGWKVVLMTAEGAAGEHPRHSRRAARRLAKAQQRVSRRKQGGRRRDKARNVLAKQHQQVRRQRQDVYHQTALALLRQYDTSSLEDVRVATRVRNHHLAKSVCAAGWAAFRSLLEAQAAGAGHHVIAVPPHCARQEWSCCGCAYTSACACAPRSVPPASWCWTATSTRPAIGTGPGRPFGDSRRYLRE